MKRKFFMSALAGATALMMSACAGNTNADTPVANQPTVLANADVEPVASPAYPQGPVFVTVQDTNGLEVVVQQYPNVMAVYDFSILDILYDVGFDRTGVSRLVTPNRETLPDALSFFRYADDLVVTGGSLHFVDWDVLDLLQPEVVVLGARSFGMNAAGERLSSDESLELRSDTEDRYSGTTFIRLAVNTTDPDFLGDMEANANAVAGIFPSLADDILDRMEGLRAEIANVHAQAQELDKRVLIITMDTPTTISAHHRESRFDMIYNEFGFTGVDDESTESASVSAEYVLRHNPDIIFFMPGIRGSDASAAIENFMSDPIIMQTTAAQTDNIHFLSSDAWHTMTGGFGATATMIQEVSQALN